MKLNPKNILFVAVVTLLIPVILIVAESFSSLSAQDSNVCFSCHEDKDLTMEKNGKKISIYVDPAAYKKSAHSVADCGDCHENYNPDEIPHTKAPKEVNCSSCHKGSKNIEASVHGKIKCYECHSKHDVKPVKEFAKDTDQNCLGCHKKKNIQQYTESIHSAKNIGCKGCHDSGHKVKKTNKQQAVSVCGKCHGPHEKNFNNSIHSAALKKGSKNAPTCTDCHGSHRIISAKISVETESCLRCHLDEKKFPGENTGSAKFVSQYRTSVHASIEKNGMEAAGCADCHGNHMIQPMDDPKVSTRIAKQMETCGKCHKEIVESFKKSKHGQELLKNNDKAPTCTGCHGEHDIQSVLISDQFSKINLTDKCLSCHKDAKIPHKNYKGEEELIQGYMESDHYKALKNGNENAPTCYVCHGAHEMEKADNPDSKISRKNVAKTCGQEGCHKDQVKDYTGSVHEKAILEKGGNDSPTCNNCHGNHVIASKKIENKLMQSKEVIQLCSHCHASVEMVERNDLPTKVTETYLESFHGLATRGGLSAAANCESCHGYHNIRPSTDPLSTINKKNLPETCGKCHPGATEALFTTKIHLTDLKEDSPWVYWITSFYIVFITSVVGFMFIHNVLDFVRKKRKK